MKEELERKSHKSCVSHFRHMRATSPARDLKIDKYEAHFEQVVPSFMEKFLKGRNEEELGRQLRTEFPLFSSFNKKGNRISDHVSVSHQL